MPRVYHVKKARKKNPVVDIGESYYWWKFMRGPKCFSRTYPRQSRLTRSEFRVEAYSIQESLQDIVPAVDSIEEMQDTISGAVDEIRNLAEETRGKHENMPESLQQGETGVLLEERADACDAWADELEAIEVGEDLAEIKEAVSAVELAEP